jgi:lysyl-tRNA synthetase class 2
MVSIEQNFLQEVLELIFIFLSEKPVIEISYAELFQQYIGIDIFSISKKNLLDVLAERSISLGSSLRWSKETLLQLILTHVIEPKMPKGTFVVVKSYPSSQAALARTFLDQGNLVAERFEIYYEGVELANGYHELTDAEELRKRFFAMKKKKLPLDERFLAALPKMGDCFGIAVGFDRLLQLMLHKEKIQDVLPFGWDEI